MFRNKTKDDYKRAKIRLGLMKEEKEDKVYYKRTIDGKHISTEINGFRLYNGLINNDLSPDRLDLSNFTNFDTYYQ